MLAEVGAIVVIVAGVTTIIKNTQDIKAHAKKKKKKAVKSKRRRR